MKTTEEIYQSLLAAFAQRAGFTPEADCDLAVRLYAAAAEIYSLYVQGEWVVRQCFPQTAEGEYLDRHAQLRGLERKEPVAARGVVRFSGEISENTDRPIPAGTVCMTAGLIRFETIEDGLLAAGQAHVDVPVQALVPGISGNVAAGTILSMAVAPAGISACSNPSPCQGGVDREGDEQLRQRVLDTFQRLPNGANAAWYEQTAMGHEGVAAARAVGRARGIGTVDVYIATAAGLPNGTLLAAVQASPYRLTTAEQFREFPDNIDFFVLEPQVKQMEDLGWRYLEQHLDLELSPALRAAIDPVPFGRQAMEEDRGCFTKYGYLSLSGDEWQHEQAVEHGRREPEKKPSIRERLEQSKKECAGKDRAQPIRDKSAPEL